MKNQIVKLVVLTLFLGLVVMVGLTYTEPVLKVKAQDIEASGVADSPPTGYSSLYTFTGVRNSIVTPLFATAVHCTNYSTSSISTTVQFFDNAGTSTYAASSVLGSNETGTFVTRVTSMYGNEIIATSSGTNIDQGSGRVTATDSQLICTVHVLDADNNPPTFNSALNIFIP